MNPLFYAKNKYYTKESIQFNYNIWYNIIK